MITTFGSFTHYIYFQCICEQTFSLERFRKNKYCSRLSDERLKFECGSYEYINIEHEGRYKQIS